jgi:lipid-A-disaccharide synthase
MAERTGRWELVITVNSPGEVSGWLTPVLDRIRLIREDAATGTVWDCRVTVFVPPCPFASGAECRVIRAIPGVDLVAGPAETLAYLLLGKKPRGFAPLPKGVVLFLGGDLAYAALLAKRLKYPALAYTEGVASWSGSFARFAVPYPYAGDKLLAKGVGKEKIRLVGNLMLDAVTSRETKAGMRRRLGVEEDAPLLLLMPGSRPAHFEGMLPFFLRTAELAAREIPGVKVVLSLSPFITGSQVAGALRGEFTGLFGVTGAYHPVGAGEADPALSGRVVTGEGLSVVVSRSRYELMSAADLALTIPGTNTMELSFLGTPMVVTLPLLYPERIPLEGLAGILGGLPGIGKILKRRLIPKLLAKAVFTAWPNRLAGEYVVPEVRGEVRPEDLAGKTVALLRDEEERKAMAMRLKAVAGETGAAGRLVELIREVLLERYGCSSRDFATDDRMGKE